MNTKDQRVLEKNRQHIDSILRYCQGCRGLEEFQSNTMLVEAIFQFWRMLCRSRPSHLVQLYGRSNVPADDRVAARYAVSEPLQKCPTLRLGHTALLYYVPALRPVRR